MPDYNNSKIYKIIDNTNDNVYIGSTCQTLIKRLYEHKAKCNSNHYKSSEIIKNGNYDIILIENYSCNDKNELHSRERYWIDNTENCINKQLPQQTKKEWSEKNKEKLSIQSKKNYEDNKEHYTDYKAKWYQENKERIQEDRAEKYIINKEEINAKNKKWYEDNKKEVREKMNVKIICECGVEYSFGNRARHFKSTIHVNSIK